MEFVTGQCHGALLSRPVNGFEFAASLVNTLAWPAVVVGIFVVGRKKVAEVASSLISRIPQIKVLEAWQAKVEFEHKAEETLRAVEDVDRQALVEKTASDSDESGSSVKIQQMPAAVLRSEFRASPRLEQLLEVDPKLAVLEAWIDLESTLRSLVGDSLDAAAGIRRRPDIRRMAKARLGDDAIGQTLFVTFDDLRHLRNQIAHNQDFEISYSAARDYLEAANALEVWLRLRDGVPQVG